MLSVGNLSTLDPKLQALWAHLRISAWLSVFWTDTHWHGLCVLASQKTELRWRTWHLKTCGCSVTPKNFANPLIHLEVVFCCVLVSQWLCSVCLAPVCMVTIVFSMSRLSLSLSMKPCFKRMGTNAFKTASKRAKNCGRWWGSGRTLPDSCEDVEPERSEAERRPRWQNAGPSHWRRSPLLEETSFYSPDVCPHPSRLAALPSS